LKKNTPVDIDRRIFKGTFKACGGIK
jgi:hypothetical protein